MINYSRLGRSVDYYESKGFQRIETPWTVTEYISNLTKPKEKPDWKIGSKNKVLVGSAEQGFLYLYLKGFLPKGSFQSISPCFREEVFDFTHSKYFVKNELIETNDVSKGRLSEIVDTSFKFLNFEGFENLEIEETEEGFDIVWKGNRDIELGSYGIRECEYLSWIYATGLAEPRAEMIFNFQNK